MNRPRLLAALAALALVPAAAQAQQPVGVRALSELLVESPAQAPAQVESLNAATLSSELTAVVAGFEVAPQAHVKSGDVLVRLDDSDYRLALAQSEAMLAAARARGELVRGRLERARRLAGDGFVSMDDVAALETELAVALADARVQESALAVTRRSLEKTRIRAPFDGQISARLAAVGQLALPGTPLLEIVDHGSVEVSAQIPAAEADSLQAGSIIHFESLGRSQRVELLRLADAIDSGTRTREARLRFIDEASAIGSQGRLIWQRPGGLLPGHLLVRRDGRLGVFLLEGEQARFHPVAGAQEGRATALALSPETVVIVEGREAIHDGDRVIVR